MTGLIAIALLLTAAFATLAALTRDPARQAVVLSGLGLALAFLFTVLQAPDVALSQLCVGTAITPLPILLTVRKVRREPACKAPGGDDGPSMDGGDGKDRGDGGRRAGRGRAAR
ncbi:Na(+)/H(+) antiporter subunit B [Kitasatospora cineracea]|uniref:Na(+)/H(+) antiporter subunit B n=1 Tax=Kitasatospora cineracea TaxID=88074 RepID=UPI0036DAA91C